jgi:hypothetical protein
MELGIRKNEMKMDKKRVETHVQAGDEREKGRWRRFSCPSVRPFEQLLAV